MEDKIYVNFTMEQISKQLKLIPCSLTMFCESFPTVLMHMHVVYSYVWLKS